jgi:hypothetical protein
VNDNVKLLEQLVLQAVDRLRELSEERDRMRGEIDGLRQRVEGAEGARSSDTEVVWQARRKELVAGLREVVAQLKGG